MTNPSTRSSPHSCVARRGCQCNAEIFVGAAKIRVNVVQMNRRVETVMHIRQPRQRLGVRALLRRFQAYRAKPSVRAVGAQKVRSDGREPSGLQIGKSSSIASRKESGAAAPHSKTSQRYQRVSASISG